MSTEISDELGRLAGGLRERKKRFEIKRNSNFFWAWNLSSDRNSVLSAGSTWF